MKIKILITPLLITLIIVLIIWFIQPVYTNGIDGVKEVEKQLEKKQALVDKLDNQSANVKKMLASLDMSYSENEPIFEYISRKKEEEKIIDSLDLLARETSLAPILISVAETKEEFFQPEATTSISESPFSALGQNDQAETPVAPKVMPKKLEASFSVVGDYQNIKSLVEKIQKLKRFNRFLVLEIKILVNEDQSISELLKVNMELEFNYLEDLKRITDRDVDNPIFTSGVFNNKDILEKINNSRSIDIKEVSPGEGGGNNPFITTK